MVLIWIQEGIIVSNLLISLLIPRIGLFKETDGQGCFLVLLRVVRRDTLLLIANRASVRNVQIIHFAQY